MQEIASLLKVIQTTSEKNNFIQKYYKPKSLESEFINGIEVGKYRSERDAAFQLYGTDQTDVRYKMLKHRIKKKILNSLLHVEISINKPLLQKEQECLRYLNLCRLLLRSYQYDIVLSLCTKIKLIGYKYGFNEMILSALELEAICVSEIGSYKQFIKVVEAQRNFQKIVVLEKEAILLFQQSKLSLKTTVKNRKIHLEKFPYIIGRLKEIWESTQSYESFNAFFKTSIHYYELLGDFSEIIKITELAEELLEKNLINKYRFSLKFNAYILVYAHLRNKSYEKGLMYAERFSAHFDETSPNWISYFENYFLLALHAQQYELASLILGKVQSSNQFINLDSDLKEKWYLYNTYLYFFEPAYSSLENFNYQKFLVSFTEYSKDKQGYNVAILILQFMYLLKKQDSEALLYKVENLKKYASTHLNDTNSLRSKLFLKLLMLIVTEDFDSKLCRIKGQKIFNKLVEAPTPGAAYAEIEIIPYEQLWETTLKILERDY